MPASNVNSPRTRAGAGIQSGRILALAIGLACLERSAFAQSGNGSDVSGPPVFSLAGGAYAPLPLTGGSRTAASEAVYARVKRTGTEFASGNPQRSPVTGQLIAAEAVQAVGELIATASPAAEARVARALQAEGASPDAVAFLTQALGELAKVSQDATPTALIAASQRFDALVKGASAAFVRSPPAMFLAIHAALVPMVNSLRR